jgi:hypothetical protein
MQPPPFLLLSKLGGIISNAQFFRNIQHMQEHWSASRCTGHMNSASHEGAFEGRVNNNRVVGEVVHGENAASLASLPDQTFTNRALEGMTGQCLKHTSC